MFFDNKKLPYILIGVMALMMLTRNIYEPQRLIGLIVSMPAILIAITFHEYAHAFVAHKLGDDTAKSQGRLTLNPIKHLDLMGTFLLLFAGFGWGKPVPVNSSNYTKKVSSSVGDALVSIAGPLMNFLLSVIFTLIYCAIYKFSPDLFNTTVGSVVGVFLITTITINIGLGVFNLIPLPPLDGSKILMAFLPYKAKRFFIEKEQVFYIIFVALWIFGLTSYIITPAIDVITKGILTLGRLIFGI